MVYIIIEIQKSNNGTVAIVPPASFHAQPLEVRRRREPSVVMLNDTGARIKGETYYHGHAE